MLGYTVQRGLWCIHPVSFYFLAFVDLRLHSSCKRCGDCYAATSRLQQCLCSTGASVCALQEAKNERGGCWNGFVYNLALATVGIPDVKFPDNVDVCTKRKIHSRDQTSCDGMMISSTSMTCSHYPGHSVRFNSLQL
jgi:hypothetical protein